MHLTTMSSLVASALALTGLTGTVGNEPALQEPTQQFQEISNQQPQATSPPRLVDQPKEDAAQTATTEIYTDEEIAEYLLTGEGKVTNDTPSLANIMLSGTEGHQFTDEEVSYLVGLVTEANPSWHEEVTVPLQSGDPFQTENALRAFGETVDKAILPADAGSIEGRCLVAPFAVVYGYVVVFVLAAAAVVAAPAFAIYYQPDSENNDFAIQSLSADIAMGFQQIG